MKRFIDLPSKLRLHIGAVVVLGLALTILIGLGFGRVGRTWPAPAYLLPILLVWTVFCSLAKLKLVLPGATMTLGSVAVSLAQIELGTFEAAIVAGLGAVVGTYAAQREAVRGGRQEPVPIYRWLFNTCDCLFAAGMGGLAYDWVYQHAPFPDGQNMLPAGLAWVVGYFIFNTAGVAMVVALRNRQPMLRVWRENFLFTAPGYLVSVSLSLALAYTLPRWGFWSVLFIPPGALLIYYYRLDLDRRAAASQYKELIDNARDGVIIIQEFKILYANEAFARMLGYERTDLEGRDYGELLAAGEALPVSLSGSGEGEFAAQSLRRADGSVVPVEISTSRAVYQSRDGAVHREGCMQALVRDVSERLAAAQSEKLRALGQMAAGVAHDFNNSLMVILGNVSLARLAMLKECGTAHEQTEQRLQAAEQASNDAAATVRRLQAFGRPARANQETFNLYELAREVLLMMRPIWRDATRAAGHEVVADLAGDPEVYVTGNPAEFREALTNLVNNAVHAMPAGGALRLATRFEEGKVSLSVSDTGVGMAPKVKERLFEPFYTTKGEKGSGLGLFVTYGLVTQHGGTIDVVSAPGAGTTFHLGFPSAEQAAPVLAEAVALPRRGARVLVVDDEAVVRDVVGSMLRDAGLSVGEVPDGRAALAALDAEAFDLVITDLSMPEMSGLELARKVREDYPQVPIVLLTGWAESSEAIALDAELVDAVLTKPTPMAQLIRQVATILAGRDETAGPPPERLAAATRTRVLTRRSR